LFLLTKSAIRSSDFEVDSFIWLFAPISCLFFAGTFMQRCAGGTSVYVGLYYAVLSCAISMEIIFVPRYRVLFLFYALDFALFSVFPAVLSH